MTTSTPAILGRIRRAAKSAAWVVGLLAAGWLTPGSALAEDNLLAILATVNGEPITLYDVLLETRRIEQQLASAETPADLPDAVRAVRRQAVNSLIDRRLLYAEFEARSYRVPEQMVEDLLDDMAADYAGGSRQDLAKRAIADGTTMDELRAKARERTAVDLFVNEICRRSVEVTPAEVLEQYRQNRDRYAEPGRISLQVLLLKHDGKLAAHPADFPARLQEQLAKADETKFAAFVKLYSEGPARDDDGRIGWLTEAELRPEFAAAVTDTPPGGIVGPIAVPEGICFLRVDRRIAPRTLSFEAVKAQIRVDMEKAESDRRYRETIDRLRAQAVIRTFFDDALVK
jgi:peptidyl-prolyl cis-trans isomerase SurA